MQFLVTKIVFYVFNFQNPEWNIKIPLGKGVATIRNNLCSRRKLMQLITFTEFSCNWNYFTKIEIQHSNELDTKIDSVFVHVPCILCIALSSSNIETLQCRKQNIYCHINVTTNIIAVLSVIHISILYLTWSDYMYSACIVALSITA